MPTSMSHLEPREETVCRSLGHSFISLVLQCDQIEGAVRWGASGDLWQRRGRLTKTTRPVGLMEVMAIPESLLSVRAKVEWSQEGVPHKAVTKPEAEKINIFCKRGSLIGSKPMFFFIKQNRLEEIRMHPV